MQKKQKQEDDMEKVLCGIEKIKSQVLILPVFEGEKTIPELKDEKLKKLIEGILKSAGIEGKYKEIFFTVTNFENPRFIIFAGMGEEKSITYYDIQKIAGITGKLLSQKDIKNYGIFLRGNQDEGRAASAWLEGLLHGAYSYNEFKTEKADSHKKIERIFFYGIDKRSKEDIQQLLDRSELTLSKVNYYRDIINAPSNYMTPSKLAKVAENMAKRQKLRCKVYGLNEIKKMNMGGIIAVSGGSRQEPRFVEIEYSPPGYKKTLVLVGKGVTFDSGGISIKPWEGMDKMKYDMAGATAVIGALDIISSLKIPLRVIGLVPVVENLPGGSAYKPGDILKMYSGRTVEVISTDAEGRLILADALSYGLRYGPDAIIDIATLTGACVIALGHEASGVLGTDRELIELIKNAGEETGERVWELPLWKEYDELIKSDHADMKNVGGREAGTIQGAVFLKRFVDNTPWAHIDIAGTAWHDNDKQHAVSGATGWGIRLLLVTAEKFARTT